MTNRSSQGHVLIVRRQSYLPSYFSVCGESQLPKDKDCTSCKLETAEKETNRRCLYLLCTGSSAPENYFEAGYFTFPLRKIAEDPTETEIHTTRLLSSGQAQRFSCNVSKMAYKMRAKMVCDGYFGCPDESSLTCQGKESVPSLRRGKPVCILPWKKRHKPTKVKKKQPSKTSNTYGSMSALKVDCLTSSLEKTKVPEIQARGLVNRSPPRPMSHPAMFYSYYIAKGNGPQYRKICALKKRTCDGYFGCDEEGTLKEKKTGKRKPLPKY